MLKITQGTGDDNVHFQSTLQLIDELHRQCKKFEFKICVTNNLDVSFLAYRKS